MEVMGAAGVEVAGRGREGRGAAGAGLRRRRRAAGCGLQEMRCLDALSLLWLFQLGFLHQKMAASFLSFFLNNHNDFRLVLSFLTIYLSQNPFRVSPEPNPTSVPALPVCRARIWLNLVACLSPAAPASLHSSGSSFSTPMMQRKWDLQRIIYC